MSAPTPRTTARSGSPTVPPVRLVVAGLILAVVTAGVSAAFVPSLAVAYGLPAQRFLQDMASYWPDRLDALTEFLDQTKDLT